MLSKFLGDPATKGLDSYLLRFCAEGEMLPIFLQECCVTRGEIRLTTAALVVETVGPLGSEASHLRTNRENDSCLQRGVVLPWLRPKCGFSPPVVDGSGLHEGLGDHCLAPAESAGASYLA